jgi:hypothetical protein
MAVQEIRGLEPWLPSGDERFPAWPAPGVRRKEAVMMNTLDEARTRTVQRCITEIEVWLVLAPASALWARAAHLVAAWHRCPNHVSEAEIADVLYAIACE